MGCEARRDPVPAPPAQTGASEAPSAAAPPGGPEPTPSLSARGREDLLEAAFRMTTVPITISSVRTNRMIELNQAACDMLGWERSEILGKTSEEIGFSIDLEDREKAWKILERDGVLVEQPIRFRRRGGAPLWGSMSGSIIDVDGEPCLLAAVMDETERHAAEQALRDSEAKFAAAFGSAGVMMLITRLRDEGRVVDVNDAFLSITGLLRDQVIGRTATELGLFADPSGSDRIVEQLRSSGKVRDLELPVITPDGRSTYGLFSADLVDLNGEPHAIMTVVDLTDRKLAEDRLRASEWRYRTLVEQTADGVLFLDGDSRIVDLNPAMAELMGRRAEDLVGTLWTDYVESQNLTQLPFLRPELQAGDAEVFERRIVRPDGSVAELEMHARHLAEGLFMGTARDVGPRKRAEQERAHLIQVIEQSVDSIMITDREGTVLYINPAMERSSGWKREEARGRSYRELQGEARTQLFYTDVLETVVREGSWSNELASRRRDDSVVVELVTVSAVRDADGELANFVVVQRDVTREHDLEERLRQAQKMEAVGRLAGGVAHDFNNLLTAISGFAELAQGEADPGGELAEYLAQIKASAERAGKLTRQLLAFGRRAVLSPAVLDLNGIALDIAPMLRRLIGEHIEMNVVTEANLRPIKADRGQLEQVIVNLVANARDAMPDGGSITISTSNVTLEPDEAHLEPGADSGDYVRLAISDTGVGMDAEMLDLIWEPFFTTKGPGSGIGLGLATVFGIVRQSGGHIHVESTPGHGSTFMIDMPAVAAEMPEPLADTLAPVLTPGQETILVVEDEPAVLGFASQLLERNGYRVLRAHDGKEALAIAEAHSGPIDLVFTDMVMPGMSGPETAAAIRAARPRIKLLFSSGYSEEMNVRRGSEAKLPFVPKPYSAEQLLEAIRLAIAE